MCMIDDCEPCDWFGTEVRVAIKAHRCAECGRTIQYAERYHYSKYVQDGSFHFNKACAHCHAARGWLTKHCGSWVTEGLLEDLEGHLGGNYGDGLERLVVGVRRQWARFAGQGLLPVPVIHRAQSGEQA